MINKYSQLHFRRGLLQYASKRALWLLTSRLRLKFLLIKVLISMNLFKTSKTSMRTYSKSVKPVVKCSTLCLKRRLIEGVTEIRMCGLIKFQRQIFNDKFNESQLSHETDCHRFDKYKHKKLLWKHLGTTTKLKVTRKTYLGCFSKNKLSRLNVQPWQL